MSLKKIFVNKDISIAKTMPSQYYLDDNYFNLTLKKIFGKSWQFIIDKDRISTGIHPFNFLETSINEPVNNPLLKKKNGRNKVFRGNKRERSNRKSPILYISCSSQDLI